MELNSLRDTEEVKVDIEMVDTICRSCLSTNKMMHDVYQYADEIAALTGIHMSPSDGLPGWVCGLCRALLRRAARFRRQWRRAHSLLYDYLTRCAPFPLEAADAELARCALPPLRRARTLAFDTSHLHGDTGRPRGGGGFAAVLQHETEPVTSPLLVPPLPPLAAPAELPAPARGSPGLDLKSEAGCSDFEDDIPLDEYKSSIGKFSADTLDQLLHHSDGSPPPPAESAGEWAGESVGESAGKSAGESAGKCARKSRKDDGGGKRKKRKTRSAEEGSENTEPKPSLRRAAEDIDPTKIRLITLNPEEQLRQLAEESSREGARLPFKCALCYKGFNYEAKLRNHMRRHSPSRGPFACALCRTHVPSAYSLRVHQRVHTLRYECIKCGRRMVDRGSMVEHYRSQHEGLAHQYTCHLCGKLSSNSKTHRGHMRNHHGGARPACHRCGKTFVNKDSLAEHLLIHDGVKNYQCSQCPQRFRTKNQAKHHQLKHSDARDHYCVECDVRFKSAHNLRQHLQKSLKHKDPKTFKFECGECGKRFESSPQRERHARVQHGGERAHACGACGAALASRAALRKHARRHALPPAPAPPQHVCHACGRAFRGKSVLVNHVRTHTGEKPFACAECGRRFAQRTACRTHVRLVHLKLRRAKIKPESVTLAAAEPAAKPEPEPEAEPPEPVVEDKLPELVAYSDMPVYF